MDLGRAFKNAFTGREKLRNSAFATPPAALPVSPPVIAVSEMPGHPTNQDRLARIGGFLEDRSAQYICIGELEEGYLLVYGRADNQTVDTLTFAEVAALPPVAARPLAASLSRQLAAIGRFLDRNQALSLFIDQQQQGYYVEYTAPPTSSYAAVGLARVNRFLDANALRNLMIPTGMLQDGQS